MDQLSKAFIITIVVMLLSLAVGYGLGYNQGQKDTAKIWSEGVFKGMLESPIGASSKLYDKYNLFNSSDNLAEYIKESLDHNKTLDNPPKEMILTLTPAWTGNLSVYKGNKLIWRGNGTYATNN